MEFSKLILIVAAMVNLTVVVFTFVMIWRTNDLSPLAYLIPAVAAQVVHRPASAQEPPRPPQAQGFTTRKPRSKIVLS